MDRTVNTADDLRRLPAAKGFGYFDIRCAGAEVRFRYQVDATEREAAARAAAIWRDQVLSAGALEVKVEEVVRPLQLARAPEVAAATTLADKLRAYWRARGMDLGVREPRVLERLRLLEQEVQA